jgi:hypothetical protein
MNADKKRKRKGKQRRADSAFPSLLLTLENVTGKTGVEGEC